MISQTRRREKPEKRKKEILQVAIDLACNVGYRNITRKMVANEAAVSCPLITKYYPTMDFLKEIVVTSAIEKEILPILAQVITMGDGHNIKKSLRKKIIAF